MMKIHFLFFFLFASVAFGGETADEPVNNTAVTTVEPLEERGVNETEPAKESRYVRLNSQLSLEYRSDRLREQQNQNTTNIRSFSLLADLFEDDRSSLTVELLGDENQNGDLNANIGKLYYQNKFSLFSDEPDSSVRVGIMKLGYGILNEIDGLFAVLPSYYSYLYDLPRGLDTGLSATTQVFSDKVFLTGSVYAGKNLRQTDNKNRDLDTVPHHLRLEWTPTKRTSLSVNYFARKYEAQPLITGVGLEFRGSSLFYLWGASLDVDSEVYRISASLNGVENEGLVGLIAPRLSYKRVFFQPYLVTERWGQAGTPDSTENYFTGKLGYNFNKHLQLVLEQTQIKNKTTGLYRENSLQARIVSQWQF